MTTIDTYEIASSILDDVCEFHPEFVGVDFTNAAIMELIDKTFEYIDQRMCELDVMGTEFFEIKAAIRLELIAMCLSCSTDNAERIYNQRKAA